MSSDLDENGLRRSKRIRRPPIKFGQTPKTSNVLTERNVNINQNKEKITKAKHPLNNKSIVWKECDQSPGLYLSSLYKDNGNGVGLVKMKGLAEKIRSKTGDYVTHLTVMSGTIRLILDEPLDGHLEHNIKTGDHFEVESNVNYSLKNLKQDFAYLSYTLLKE